MEHSANSKRVLDLESDGCPDGAVERKIVNFRTEETMANNSTRSAKPKVIHAGFLLADPDIQPKSGQSILIEGERIKAVSSGFIDPPPGGELIDLRKKFVLPGLIDCHVQLTTQLDRDYRF